MLETENPAFGLSYLSLADARLSLCPQDFTCKGFKSKLANDPAEHFIPTSLLKSATEVILFVFYLF